MTSLLSLAPLAFMSPLEHVAVRVLDVLPSKIASTVKDIFACRKLAAASSAEQEDLLLRTARQVQ